VKQQPAVFTRKDIVIAERILSLRWQVGSDPSHGWRLFYSERNAQNCGNFNFAGDRPGRERGGGIIYLKMGINVWCLRLYV
jgi:hypothetical protein